MLEDINSNFKDDIKNAYSIVDKMDRQSALSEIKDRLLEKYSEDENGRAVRREETDQMLLELEEDGLNPSEHIALPNPSYFPIVLASGLPFLGYAVIYKSIPLALIATVLLLVGGFGWGTEPLEEEIHLDSDE